MMMMMMFGDRKGSSSSKAVDLSDTSPPATQPFILSPYHYEDHDDDQEICRGKCEEDDNDNGNA